MIKKTSWLAPILTPSRWGEFYTYFVSWRLPRDGASDRPDPRDLDAKVWLKGTSPRIPKKKSNLEIPFQKQWKPQKQSRNSCTAYSKGFAVEIANTTEEGSPVYIDKELQWKHQEKTGASRDSGDFIQNAEKQFHDNPQGFPQTEYRRIRAREDNIENIKKWLCMGIGRTIRTGISWQWVINKRMSNSTYMKKTGFFIPGDGQNLGGHATLIVGFDDDKECPDGSKGALKMFEPELETWGDNPPGVFWVSYKHINNLFSKYISRDAINKTLNNRPKTK